MKDFFQVLPSDLCMYAVSQGAMAVECRADDAETLTLLSQIHDLDTAMACIAERAFLKTLVNTFFFNLLVRKQFFVICLLNEHSKINILQWILTKLGTYLVLKRIWNSIDFQGHRSKIKVTGSNFYRITSL